MRKLSLLLLLSLVCATSSYGFVQQETILKKKAFLKKSQKGLFQFLDLKKKQITFEEKDLAQCKNTIQMNWSKMKFRCIVNLAVSEKATKLHKVISPKTIDVQLPHISKKVYLKVNKKTNYIIYQTSFDRLGIDIDEAAFNKDLREVYAQIATEVIARAMAKPIVFTVLESH